MEAKKILIFVFVLSFAASFWLIAQEKEAQKKDPAPKSPSSLIRKELLSREPRALEPARRNIFSPQRAGTREREPNLVAIPQDVQRLTTPPSGPGTNRLLLDLSYIGCIISDKKIIGLVIFEGDVLAVEKGEWIGEGIKVTEVTPAEIEVIGPDSEKRKFPVKGDNE